MQVTIEDKYDRVKRLMDVGKERGYVLYDEVSDVLPADINGGGELDDVLAGFDGAGIEILEDPKPEFDKKLDDGEEVLDLELPPGIGEKTNDPVRMYLREMGAVALLTRESEVEIAKRIERGQRAVSKALSRSPLVIQKILALGEEVRCEPSGQTYTIGLKVSQIVPCLSDLERLNRALLGYDEARVPVLISNRR